MKTKIYSIIAVSFLGAILFSSCKSVNKLYQKGDYDEAVYTAVKKLQKNKLTEETRELVADAYAKAINQRKATIENLHLRNDELRWEGIVYEYEQMQGLSDAINRSPEALEYVKPLDFNRELAEARGLAADTRYNRAMQWMRNSDKQSARYAWNELNIASRYKPNDAGIENMKRQAYDAAATYVVIAPASARYYNMDEYARDMERDLVQHLQYNSPNQFVKFYSGYEADRLNLQADHVIEIRYDDIRRGNLQTDRNRREVYKDNVLLSETWVRPDSVVRKYGRVTATITQEKQTQVTEGMVYLAIKDINGSYPVLDRRVEAEYCWTNEYASYSGDERALSENDKALVNRGRTTTRPDERQMMSSINRELYNKLCSELRQFYSRI